MPPSAIDATSACSGRGGGEECRKLAKAAPSVYQTGEGLLKSCNSTSVASSAINKFADTQILRRLDAVSLRVLSEEHCCQSAESFLSPCRRHEQRDTRQRPVSSVSAFASKGLWISGAAESTTTNPSAWRRKPLERGGSAWLDDRGRHRAESYRQSGTAGLQAAAAPAEACITLAALASLSCACRARRFHAPLDLACPREDRPHRISRWCPQIVPSVSLFSPEGKLQSGGSDVFWCACRQCRRQMRRVRRSCVFVDCERPACPTPGCSVVANSATQFSTSLPDAVHLTASRGGQSRSFLARPWCCRRQLCLAKLKFWHFCCSATCTAIIVAIAAAVRRDQLIQTEADLVRRLDTLVRPSTCLAIERPTHEMGPFLRTMLAVCAIKSPRLALGQSRPLAEKSDKPQRTRQVLPKWLAGGPNMRSAWVRSRWAEAKSVLFYDSSSCQRCG
uniref:Transmembrane protein n=1 Tax=Macrostomum lignano TaxID=282301 RepID=A0A1I8FC18_9PLAT